AAAAPVLPPLPDFAMVGLVSPDSQTLIVTLNDPVTFFLDVISFSPFFPLHEPSMGPFAQKDDDGRVRYDQQFTRPPNIVTNGAYKLVTWDFKRHLRLAANPFYWDKPSVKSRSIEMVVVEDA